MEDREKYLHLKNVFINIVMFLVTLVIVITSSFFYTKDITQIIRNAVITCICLGTIIFLLTEARIKHTFQEDNEEHPIRFTVCFLVSILLAVLLPILPTTGWPYAAIFITLTFTISPTLTISEGFFMNLSLISEM